MDRPTEEELKETRMETQMNRKRQREEEKAKEKESGVPPPTEPPRRKKSKGPLVPPPGFSLEGDSSFVNEETGEELALETVLARRRKVLRRINKFRTLIGLKGTSRSTVESTTEDDLQLELEHHMEDRNSQFSYLTVNKAYSESLGVIELGSRTSYNPVPSLNFTGTKTRFLEEDPENAKEELNEIAVIFDDWFGRGAVSRLLFKTFTLCKNMAEENINGRRNIPVPPAVQEEAEGL